MDKDWIHIDELTVEDLKVFNHCDTRDFHMISMIDDEDQYRTNFFNDIHLIPNWKDHFYIPKDEVLKFLKELESKSGGVGEWRLIEVKPLIKRSSAKYFRGWLKYIRFYAIDENGYLVYTTSSGKYYPVYYKELDDIVEWDKEHMNFIKSMDIQEVNLDK